MDTTHPTNGSYNIKLTRLESGRYYYNLIYRYELSQEDYGKTATLTVDITNNLNNAALLMMGGSSKSYITIPKNSQGTFSVSYIIPSDLTKLECLIPTFSGITVGVVFVDNICLNIQ